MKRKMVLHDSRVCFSCKRNYPLNAKHFYRSNDRYYQRECKSCNKIRRAKWWKSDTGKRSAANTKLKCRFGITMTQYEVLLQECDYQCLICGSRESQNHHRLAVDHDHATNRIRGLLCKQCNVGLGNFRDSVNLLQSAILYLTKER